MLADTVEFTFGIKYIMDSKTLFSISLSLPEVTNFEFAKKIIVSGINSCWKRNIRFSTSAHKLKK